MLDEENNENENDNQPPIKRVRRLKEEDSQHPRQHHMDQFGQQEDGDNDYDILGNEEETETRKLR
eukprot:UN11704